MHFNDLINTFIPLWHGDITYAKHVPSWFPIHVIPGNLRNTSQPISLLRCKTSPAYFNANMLPDSLLKELCHVPDWPDKQKGR